MHPNAKKFLAFGAALAAAATMMTGVSKADMWDKERKDSQDVVKGETGSWDNIKKGLFADKEIADGTGVINFEAPPRVTDAAFIPLTIGAAKPQTADHFIKNIYLVIDENPSPVAAVFHLSPDNGLANISTRVRIDKYTYVRAIAETNDGKLYMAKSFLKAAGGCSAPTMSDNDEARARIGKMKMNFVKAASSGQPGEAQILVSHPNFTGFQYDQIERREIPADYVSSIEVTYGSSKVFSVDSGISISENPSFFFNYKDQGSAEMKATAKDSEGHVFEKTWPVGKSDVNG